MAIGKMKRDREREKELFVFHEFFFKFFFIQIQMVISDAWDAFFRDGICIFFAFSGVGTYEVQRMRAVSALWAMAIMALGLWQYIYTNPAAVPYYGGTFTYWLTHDIAGACLHLTLLLLYLRPGFLEFFYCACFKHPL